MASRKAALGKGLSALLPSQDDAPRSSEGDGGDGDSGLQATRLYKFEEHARLLGRVADVEVQNVRPNPYQPRRDFSDKALDELAASIKQLGIIQPITVRSLGSGHFEIISGERRLRAARRAGLKRIPAYVRDADSEAMLEMALVENVQRQELNPIEVALGYQRLVEECGLTQQEVADKVGKGRATVANALRLLKLPPKAQASLRDGSVSTGHARALINVDDDEAQINLLEEVVSSGLSVREVEDRVRAFHQQKKEAEEAHKPELFDEEETQKPAQPDANQLQVKHFNDRLRSRLATQVQIKHKGDGSGRVVISYYSPEDLERLMDALDA